jgi:hypothetical protein
VSFATDCISSASERNLRNRLCRTRHTRRLNALERRKGVDFPGSEGTLRRYLSIPQEKLPDFLGAL